MNSKKISKRVVVSFIAAGFLVSGVGASVSEQVTNFVLKNANITGNANSNTTIADFTANATTSISSFVLKFTSSDNSYNNTATRSLSHGGKLNVQIVDSSGNVVTGGGAIASQYLSTSGETSYTFNLSGLTSNSTYSVRVNPDTSGAEGRFSLTNVAYSSTPVTFTTPNTIDLIIPPMLDAVTAQSSSSLRLSYSSTSSYSSTMHYLGYRGTSSTTQSTAINGGSFMTSTSSFDDTGLSSSTYYYYKICAARSDITSTNAYSVLCSTANSGMTSSSYVATTTPTTTSTNTEGETGAVYGGTIDETASTETTSVIKSEVTTVDTTTTSQTTTTVDDTTGTSEINVALTDTTTGTSDVQTTVSMSSAATVEMQTDGSVKATEKTDSGDTNSVTVSKNGNTAMESIGKDKSYMKANVPAGKEGAKVKTDTKTGKMTAETKMDSKETSKEVKISVEIDPTNKGSKTSISKEAFPTEVINQISGGNANITIVTGAPAEAGVLESSTDLLLGNGTSRNLRATTATKAVGVKTTFKSTRSFFASKKTLSRATDFSEAKTVEIFPTTAWQKFEEVVLFNGKRSLVLLLGGADIIIDGERVPMIPNQEYLLPLQIEVGGEVPATTEPVYTANKLSLTAGWNLVSLPVDKTVDDLSIFGDYSVSWKYSNKAWSKNPTTLNKAEGIWFKMNSVNEVEFIGDAYSPIVADLATGWNLIGTGETLTNFKSNNSLEAVWSFQNNKWSSNPETIYAGQGFWIKK